MRLARQAAGIGRPWIRIVALSQCVCLLMAGTAVSAENQVLPVGPSESKQFRKLLKGKRINAILAEWATLVGQVKKVQDGLVLVNIHHSAGPNDEEAQRHSTGSDRYGSFHPA